MKHTLIPTILVASLTACGDPAICLPMAEPSFVSIKNDQGDPVEASELRFSVSGEPEQTLTCGATESGADCATWAIAHGISGSFTVTAVGCGVEATITFEVPKGECGSVSQRVDLILPCPT